MSQNSNTGTMKRIAIKVGSNVLTRQDGTLDITRMSALTDQVAELHRRGVPRELWDAALEQMPENSDKLDALIQKKTRGDLADPKERKRVCDALLRRGFSWSEVRAAMGRYTDFPEE